MIKVDFELNLTAEELTQALDKRLKSVTADTSRKLARSARNEASNTLKSGSKFWKDGFSVDKVSDGVWILSLSGKMATMMEDGFGVGEIKRLLLGGNRAKYNKMQGKNYVDVPIKMSGAEVKKAGVKLQEFRDADSIIKHFSVSDYKNGGIKKESKITQRVKDIIKMRDSEESKSSFVTIKRVSENSKGWPSKPYKGAKVFESLDSHIEKAFEESLAKLI